MGKIVKIETKLRKRSYVLLVTPSCPTLCNPMDCSPRLLCPWGFSRLEHWSGLPCPPPENLPSQGPNPGLLHCSQILYHLSPGKPKRRYTNGQCRQDKMPNIINPQRSANLNYIQIPLHSH